MNDKQKLVGREKPCRNLGCRTFQGQRSGGMSVGGAVGSPELVLRDGRESGRKGGQRQMGLVGRQHCPVRALAFTLYYIGSR